MEKKIESRVMAAAGGEVPDVTEEGFAPQPASSSSAGDGCLDVQPTLYLFIDHTHLSPWTCASLEASKDRLAAQGYDVAPPLPGDVPRWSEYWHMGVRDADNPTFLAFLAAIHGSLSRGRNVILPGAYFDLDITRLFLARIRDEFGTAARAAVFFEKPALMLDWWWRRVPTALQPVLANEYVFKATQTARMFDLIRASGFEVSFFFNDDAALTQGAVKKQLRRMYRFAGAGGEPILSRAYAHPDWLTTNTGKILTENFIVGQNAWPPLDTALAYRGLIARQIPWRPGVPWSLRRRFLAREARDREALSALTGVDMAALAPPEAFAEPRDCSMEKDVLFSLFQGLDPEVRTALFTRLENDAALLNDSQKLILASLREFGGFSRLDAGEEPPLLTVLTLAFNHEKFIAECIESVLAQKTDFPVRHLVVDNYSTDSTPKIISNYAKDYSSVRPVLLQGDCHDCNGVRELLSRGRSEYVSLCDGDDYFTDPQKLQKQVNFLNANRDCALCFHPVLVHFADDPARDFIYPPASVLDPASEHKLSIEALFRGNLIQTNSVVYRWRFRDGLPDWFDDRLCPGDWYWHLLHAETGLLGFLPQVMSVYRRHADALYRHAFKDTLAHRKSVGMAELRTFDVVLRHFGARWRERINGLAAGVFSDFLRIYLEENDASLLDEASVKYPAFAKDFLTRIEHGHANH